MKLFPGLLAGLSLAAGVAFPAWSGTGDSGVVFAAPAWGKARAGAEPAVAPESAVANGTNGDTSAADAASDAGDTSAADAVSDAGDTPEDAVGDPFDGAVEAVAADKPLDLDNVGIIDGIYVCGYAIAGRNQSVYVAVNGKRDGQTVFVIANVSDNGEAMTVSGWGIGKVVAAEEGGYAYVGQTDSGQSFFFGVDFDADGGASAAGDVGVTFSGGETLQAELACKSIW